AGIWRLQTETTLCILKSRLSLKSTLPPSMKHSEPQLSDTPTCDEAAEPLISCLVSSKYRRLTLGGILFGAYLGIGIPSDQDSQRLLDTDPRPAAGSAIHSFHR
ncbi:hypothetical protein QK290_16460, partial [Pseudarthrobacter sp. AL07]|uniref:hypothetical protein n=1 Tax=unclassified Pseudarthrobacter TaxID=2647000 RepID=UPI002499B85F